MAPSKDRQRALARAKLERQMAKRAATARRRRQIQAAVAGTVALVLVVLGAFWLVSEVSGDGSGKAAKAEPTPTPGACKFTDQPKKAKADEREDVGKPKVGDVVRKGVRVLTMNTNLGKIVINLDAEKAPCNTASLAYLASKKFFDDSQCHRLTDQGLFVLQCGDPSATGRGGPTYQVNDENLPTDQRPPYPQGTVAMANSGPGTNGSQFFLVYEDTQLDPAYTIVGEIVEGLDIVKEVAKAGAEVPKGGQPGDGKPKKEVTLETVTVSEPQPAS